MPEIFDPASLRYHVPGYPIGTRVKVTWIPSDEWGLHIVCPYGTISRVTPSRTSYEITIMVVEIDDEDAEPYGRSWYFNTGQFNVIGEL